MIDYLQPDGQRALYVPDFFVRTQEGDYYLVELKGRQDELVPLKASAAVEWCKSASSKEARWRYLYVPYHLFQQGAASAITELAQACEPTLQGLLNEWKKKQLALPIDEETAQYQADALFNKVLKEAGIGEPRVEVVNLMRQAVLLLDHAIRSRQPTLGHAFQPLLGPLDHYAQCLLEKCLKPSIPSDNEESILFFNPNLEHLPPREQQLLEKHQRYLRDNLVFGRSIQRLGALLFCLGYAYQSGQEIPGIWQTVKEQFSAPPFGELYGLLQHVNEFRNTRVAHVEAPLTDENEAWEAMRLWLRSLNKMAELCG